MSDAMPKARASRGEIRAACSARAEYLLPLLFIALGSLCFWQARDMSQLGAVFPMTIAAVMILASVLRLLQLTLHRVIDNIERHQDSTPRRVLLVVAMAVWALLMPWAGFLLTGLASFVTLMLIAQHDAWTSKRLVSYLIAGAVLVACFYGLFALLLNVPLPVGRWFMG
ncbi:hypothetical protein GCM10007160_00840 [Litchfieldella qijiaojingensis]|uniref:DUF1468 domain-containing protein n=1 Tax=Litchfieldella qijiaojingensis TaxID=980347 RepID=A0ABQ2Y9W4_9GAMM|nr:tripartite tricarboxylate transporter TctB family protein [Halomonas qijiaojingensis]GGX77457.1 hypothetical protein GCM10007160_00840 [Halomonas qijiaojingensis]